jgi:hypothetical protein
LAASVVAAALTVAAPAPAHAECVASADRLEAAIAREAGRARTWRLVWGYVNDAFAMYSFTALPLVDRPHRIDYAASGVGSVASAALTFGLPLDVEGAARPLYDARALAPCARLEKLRSLRAAYADDERARVTWPWHALNVVLAGAVLALVGGGLGHVVDGLTSAAGTLAVGELQLVTQPTGLTLVSF